MTDTIPTPDPADRPAPIAANLFTPPYQRGVIQLPLVVHVDAEALWAEIPGMPGLFATGVTPRELGTSLGEAVELYLGEAVAATDESTTEPTTEPTEET